MIKIINMKKLRIAFIVFIFVFYFGSGFVFSDSLDISQETVERGFPVRHATDGDWTAGQSFIPSFDVLTRSELSIRKLGSPDFDLTLELRRGSVTGNLLDSQTYSADSISSSFSWVEFNFTDVTVSSGIKYYIVAALPPNGLENSFGYELGYVTEDLYSDGNLWYTNNTGASWFELTDNDLAFRTYGYDIPTPTAYELDLSVSSPIDEGDVFQVYVSSEGKPVEGASVNFSGSTYSTNSNGQVSIVAPYVDEDTTYKITAWKISYLDTEIYVTVINQDSVNIEIVYPNGGEILNGIVEISWDIPSPPIADSFVTIKYKYSDESWVNIIENYDYTSYLYEWDTKTVEDGGPYLIKVILNYEGGTSEDTSDSSFTIDNSESISYGSIYGTVRGYDQTGNLTPIVDAMVCAIHKYETTITKSECVFTDEEGEYIIKLNSGTYDIIVSKTGYETKTSQNIQVENNDLKKLDFILNQTIVKKTKTLTEYVIDEEIKKGSIIGSVDISSEEEQVSTYDSNIDLELLSADINTKQGINIKISGEGADGTKIVVYLGELDSPDDLVVLYDDVEITQTDDAESFLQLGYAKSEYLLTSTIQNSVAKPKYILLINNAHYSEHEIVISLGQIAETLGGTTAILYYVSFFVIVAALFAGIGTIRKRF